MKTAILTMALWMLAACSIERWEATYRIAVRPKCFAYDGPNSSCKWGPPITISAFSKKACDTKLTARITVARNKGYDAGITGPYNTWAFVRGLAKATGEGRCKLVDYWSL